MSCQEHAGRAPLTCLVPKRQCRGHDARYAASFSLASPLVAGLLFVLRRRNQSGSLILPFPEKIDGLERLSPGLSTSLLLAMRPGKFLTCGKKPSRRIEHDPARLCEQGGLRHEEVAAREARSDASSDARRKLDTSPPSRTVCRRLLILSRRRWASRHAHRAGRKRRARSTARPRELRPPWAGG